MQIEKPISMIIAFESYLIVSKLHLDHLPPIPRLFESYLIVSKCDFCRKASRSCWFESYLIVSKFLWFDAVKYTIPV